MELAQNKNNRCNHNSANKQRGDECLWDLLQGHTELLAELTGAKRFWHDACVSGPLRVILVTTHLALKDVPRHINKDRVYKTILLANKAMKYFKIPNPRIGLAALNPHAGEGKLFGTEEWTKSCRQ